MATVAPLIPVSYSCPECGLVKVACHVREREAGEDIVVWITMVGSVLSTDHHRRSPECRPKELKDLMIPMDGRQVIGGPIVQ